MNNWIWPTASKTSCSPCCLRVGWGAVWDPLRSLCKLPPNRIRRPSGRCSQSCRNPVKPKKTHWKARRILSHQYQPWIFSSTSNIWHLIVLPVWVLALFQAAGWSDCHGELSPSLWSASWWQLDWWGSQQTGWWDTTPWYTGPDWWTTPTWPLSPLLLVPPSETQI